jgi:predicted small lipoprotein YifL
VNLIADLPRFALFSSAALLSAGLSACGQTGPLYMPAKPAAVVAPAGKPATAPAKSDAAKPAPERAPDSGTTPAVPVTK